MVREAADKKCKQQQGLIMCGQKFGQECQIQAQRKERQQWTMKRQKFDSARTLRGMCFIDPEDAEFKETSKTLGKVGIVHGSSRALYGQEPPVQGILWQRTRHSQIEICMHRGSSLIRKEAFGVRDICKALY